MSAIHLLCCLDRGYIPQLRVMLCSALQNEPGELAVHIAHTGLTDSDFAAIARGFDLQRLQLLPVCLDPALFAGAPTQKRYPKEMYYRLFAAQYLPPAVHRVLYLDPDTVVIGPLGPLYHMDMGGCPLAAAGHLHRFFTRINQLRLGLGRDVPYLNSGVLLMDLDALRAGAEKTPPQVYAAMARLGRWRLWLPDQDLLAVLYGGEIKELDGRAYNVSDRYLRLYNLNPQNRRRRFDADWVRRHGVIIHYFGKNKPWKPGYRGVLGGYYHQYDQIQRRLAAGGDDPIKEATIP